MSSQNLSEIRELRESIEAFNATIDSLRAFQNRSFVSDEIARIDKSIEKLIIERERIVRYHASATEKIDFLYSEIRKTTDRIRDLSSVIPLAKLGKISQEEKEERKLRKVLQSVNAFVNKSGSQALKQIISEIKSDIL